MVLCGEDTLPGAGHHSDGSSRTFALANALVVDQCRSCTALLCQHPGLMVAQQQYVPNMAVKTSQQLCHDAT